jgi:tetratricopeptide (TPR) repeat protein
MKSFLIPVLLSLAVGSSAVNIADSESLRGQYDSTLISDIIYYVFTDRYDSALSLCDSIIKARPGDPSGHFFRAYTLMTAMTEEHDNLYQEAYFESLDSVESLVNTIIDTCRTESRAWCYWYLGNVWAYRSLWKARFGSAASAYKLASKARKYYEASLEIDSSLYDNYAGLGAVHYWKSAKGRLFRTLGFIRDEREKGIAELKIAAKSSILSRETAQKTLITILADFKQYDSSITYAENMLAHYPDSRSFLWGISWAYYHKGDYDRASEYFKKLRRILAQSPGNFYKLIVCDAQITRCLESLGQIDDAREWAVLAEEYITFVSDQVRDKQKDNLKYLAKVARR